MAKFLRICKWEQYQHYKDRNPPWIKLHREFLTSYTWTVLDDASRLLAVACMILAAETGNKIPLDRDFIQRRTQLRTRPDVRKLIEVGFAEMIDEPELSTVASDLLADASSIVQVARPETEAETEKETPKNKRAYRLPEDWTPKPGHYQLAKELNLLVDVELPKFRDHFLGSGATKFDWDATFRNWLSNAVKYGGNRGEDRKSVRQPSTQHRRWEDNNRAIEQAFGARVDETSEGDSSGQTARLGPGGPRTLEGKII